MQEPQLAQLAMCVEDLPRTIRFYREVLGFGSAGGKVIWGDFLARVQGLGEDAQCIVWWMLGRQDFVQLEFFVHTKPIPRPLPSDWRPSDLGYVRWGVAVRDFDDVLARLAAKGVALMAPAQVHNGLRRACFRDPDGIVVEVMEDGPGLPGPERPPHHPFEPSVVYAAISVPDLAAARRFYVDTLGLVEQPGLELHTTEMEALWGLPGARRDVLVARAGEVLFEMVEYHDPAPRPKPADAHLADRGFLNVAFAYRSRADYDAMLARVLAAGYATNAPVAPGTGFASTYANDGMGTTAEIFACPREFDPFLGFEPEPGFAPPRPR